MKLNFDNEKFEGRRDTLENCGCCNEYKLFNTKQNKKKAGQEVVSSKAGVGNIKFDAGKEIRSSGRLQRQFEKCLKKKILEGLEFNCCCS